jgi:putative restriction endonuclease
VNAWVAVTDKDWFDFLSSREVVDEVNFWQPRPWGGRFQVLARGAPLLFKLKSPHSVIAGGGFFEAHTTLPLSLAWQAFAQKNGAATHQEVWNRITRLRGETVPSWADPEIGCIILSDPFFWPEDLWIRQPTDFSRNIVRGKSYDLRREPGRSLWREVAARVESNRPPAPGTQDRRTSIVDPSGGYAEPALTRRRIGQGTFQVIVTEAYGRSCAVTGERALPALDAAHIRPFADLQSHTVNNGLLLRSDVHRLFDAGYITVTPAYRVEASDRMREDFNDGENYLKLHGASINLPARSEDHPGAEYLRWHNDKRFRG